MKLILKYVICWFKKEMLVQSDEVYDMENINLNIDYIFWGKIVIDRLTCSLIHALVFSRFPAVIFEFEADLDKLFNESLL